MTRFRLRTGPAALFGAVFVLALVLLVPLRLALGAFDLDSAGLAAREVTGSVWSGTLREAQAGGIALGDLDAGVSPLPLLSARAQIGLAGDSGMRALHGAISVSRHSIGMDDMTARIPAGALFAPLPISGLDLDDVSVRFVDGKCATAEGRVKATLSGDVAGMGLGQGLAGSARCDAGVLLLPLASQAGTERIALRLWDSGRFRAELSVRPGDADTAQKLEQHGFQPTAQGHILSVDGKF